MRVLASTMRLAFDNEMGDGESGQSGEAASDIDFERLVPVRSKEAIPLARQMAAMQQIRTALARRPIHMGDVLIANVANTGVDIVASCDA